MDVLPYIGFGAAAVVGTLGWMVVAVASLVVVARMDKHARGQVPAWVWVPYGGALALSVIWPLGILASLAALGTGGFWAWSGPGASRPAGLASAAVGGAYLALVTVVAVGGLLLVQLQPT